VNASITTATTGDAFLKGLTPRQQLFVHEYLTDFKATEAAVRAGYSRRSAHVTASRLLRKSQIREAIVQGKEAAADRASITIDGVLEQLCRIAFADMRKLFMPDGTLRNISDLDEDTAAAIASMEVEESSSGGRRIGRTRRVKLRDPISALCRLGEYLGMFDQVRRIPWTLPATPASERHDVLPTTVKEEVSKIFLVCAARTEPARKTDK
jgi:phage terminase small subunit